MKKIILIISLITFYFLKSYSQDTLKPVTFSHHKIVGAHMGAGGNVSYREAKIIYYKIGEGEEKLFYRPEEKIYKNYISSNKRAVNNFKVYKGFKAAKYIGAGICIAALPVLLTGSIPAALVLIITGAIIKGSSRSLSEHFIKKSAKIFNKGLIPPPVQRSVSKK